MQLRTRLLLTLLVVAILPISLVGWLAFQSTEQEMRREIAGNSLEYARLTLSRINDGYHARYRLYQHVSREFANHLDHADLAAIDQALLDLTGAGDEQLYALLLDTQGRVLSSSIPSLRDVNLGDDPRLQKALTGPGAIQKPTFDNRVGSHTVLISVPVIARSGKG